MTAEHAVGAGLSEHLTSAESWALRQRSLPGSTAYEHVASNWFLMSSLPQFPHLKKGWWG